MKLSIALAVAAFAIQRLAASDSPEFVFFHFAAKVESVELVIDPLDPYGHSARSYSKSEIVAAHGQLLFVGFEARWHIRMTVSEGASEGGSLPIGSMVTFVVPSPSRSLMGNAEETTGKEYRFRLVGCMESDGRITLIDLHRDSGTKGVNQALQITPVDTPRIRERCQPSKVPSRRV